MSYNTRRTGAGPGGRAPTQVNYHQQPPRTGSNPSQSRNPGYSTQQSNYNTSSQPAYTTQTGYSTQPPLPKPQPQSQPAAAQPLPSQPPQVKQTPPSTPVLKQEPTTPADTPSKIDTTENGGEGSLSKPFWRKKPFVKVSNKVKKARQNAKLRRILNPKNALTFLNELRPGGVKFVVREEIGWGFVATVDIDGKTYTGHAPSSSKAKVLASEQALKHLLLEQLSKSQAPPPAPVAENKDGNTEAAEENESEDKEENGESKAKRPRIEQPEDDVPWGSLAAFALHKLFAEWQKDSGEMMSHGPSSQEKYDDDVGEEPYFTRRPGPPPPEFGYPRRFLPGPYPRGRGFAPYPPRGPPPPGFGMPRRPPPAAPFQGGRPPLHVAPKLGSMLPMKKIPEDANKKHPVMLLNQLKPNIVYNESRQGDPPNLLFIISVEIDGKEFTGQGKNKKEAKKNAAIAALAPMGIIYEEED